MNMRHTVGALLGAGLMLLMVVGTVAADTEGGGTGTTGPGDNAWLLVVALGVLVASIVVLTPRRPGKTKSSEPERADGDQTEGT